MAGSRYGMKNRERNNVRPFIFMFKRIAMISEYTTAPITARKAYHTVALIESQK